MGKQDREKFSRQKLFGSERTKSQWPFWSWPPFSRWFEGQLLFFK